MQLLTFRESLLLCRLKNKTMSKLVFRLLLLFLLSFFVNTYSFTQEKPKKEVHKLTHHMSPEEKARFHTVGKGYEATDPPPGPVCNIAEFEQMEGVLIRYPFGISIDLIAGMSGETMVTTVVENQNEQNSVTNQYQNNGVNMDNVNFLLAESNSYWTRDYGPWYVRYGQDQIGIVDFIYNRPDRPDDNAMPIETANFLGIEWFGMDLITAGGNYMTDGYGISSSSDLIWEENPTLTHEEIGQMVSDYLGIETYHVVPDPNNTYIDHIDCWGKFLDVDKVLIRSVPESHPQYDEIETTADYYANHVSAYGDNYQVYRVYTPNNEPYTNSLILNDRVFVPIIGSSWDDEAIETYEEAMPGYEILGYTGSWESTDALHCRTKGIADRNMLYIKHFPLLGNQPIQVEYEIEVELTAYSGELIVNDLIKVIYWVNGGIQEEIEMTYQGDKLYSAIIPGAPEGSEIAYYIHAEDQGGNISENPLIGQPDPHVFYIGEQFFAEIGLDVSEINGWVNQGYADIEEFTITNSGQIELNYSIEWSTTILEDYTYDIEDSPSQSSWDNNTFSELGWTEFEIDNETGEIANWMISYHWQTDNWPEEGTFRVESPDGTQSIIAAGTSTGDYTISLDAFNGEQMQGTWKLWITDSYGDGGHQATNISVTVTKSYEVYPWLSVAPINGSVAPGGSNTIQAICDGSVLPLGDYEGKIFITSNDPDQSIIEIPVYFTVDFASEVNEFDGSEINISNYPNPFISQTIFNINLPKASDVLIEVYNFNGQKINTLTDEYLNAGNHRILWNGENTNGNKVKSGIYFYKLSTGDFEQINKLILVD